jgi:hypothetical protein
LIRDAKFADDDDVERGVDCVRHLGSDGYTATRETQHHWHVELGFCYLDAQELAG